MSITGLSHVSITVADLERSKTWYEEALDWNCVMEDRSDTTTFADGVLTGGTPIGLRVPAKLAETRFDERRVGHDHLSLTATDTDDLTEVEERLRSRGATFTP